jgi:hypothetical protein
MLPSYQSTGILSPKGETDKMRRLALAIVLACALSGAARAGEIHTTGVARAGEIHSTGVVAPQQPLSSAIAVIVLTIISIAR